MTQAGDRDRKGSGGVMGRRAVFLDRDGVINELRVRDWVTRWEEFRFLPGVKDGIAALKKAGFLVIIVTNQSCVTRGLISEEGLADIHRRMLEELGEGMVDGLYCCPHQDEDECGCRKPEPGMLVRAADDFGIDCGNSYMVGDSGRDMAAAAAAGVRRILVEGKAPGPVPDDPDIGVVKDLGGAVELILAGAGEGTETGTCAG